MANLAQSAVSIQEVYKTGGTSGRKYKAVDAILTLSGQGGLTNTIPVALFGMTKIKEVRNCRTSTSVIMPAAPSYDGSVVAIGAVGTGIPTDSSATVQLTVIGNE